MVVEIPKGGCNKYEYDVLEKAFKLDRVLPGANYYPGEYGFIKNTLDFDGDPLDVIALSTYPTFPGCIVTVRVLGEIHMIDEGEKDTKLFGVLDNDPRFNHITSLEQVSKHLTDPIIDFFQNYKNLQNKKVEVSRNINKITKAQKTLLKCQKLFEKYNYLIQNNQKEKLMSKLHEEQNPIKKKSSGFLLKWKKQWGKKAFPLGKYFPIDIKKKWNLTTVKVEIKTLYNPKFKILKNSIYYTQIDPVESPNSKNVSLYNKLEEAEIITKEKIANKYKITFNIDYQEFTSASQLQCFLQCHKKSANGWELFDKLKTRHGDTVLIDFNKWNK